MALNKVNNLSSIISVGGKVSQAPKTIGFMALV